MVSAVEPLFEPVGIIWVLSLGGFAGSLWRRQFRAALLFSVLTVFITVAGSSLPSHWLSSLEKPYSNIALDKVPSADAVVVLGGAGIPSENDCFGFDADGAVDRVITGVEVVRRGKAAALVFGGGGGKTRNGQPWHEAALWQTW